MDSTAAPKIFHKLSLATNTLTNGGVHMSDSRGRPASGNWEIVSQSPTMPLRDGDSSTAPLPGI